MKNILFFIESLQCGGAEKSIVSLFNLYNFENNKVDLLLLNKGGNFEKFIPSNVNILYVEKNISLVHRIINKIRYIILNIAKGKAIHPAQIFWSSYKNSFKPIDKKYDVAIAYNQGFATYFIAEKVEADLKYSWINTDYVKAGYSFDVDKQYYLKMKSIICVSKEGAAIITNILASNQLTIPVEIIPDLIDVELIKELSSKEIVHTFDSDKTKIMTVGRLAHAKGIDLAIKAAYSLKNYGIKFVWYIIGEGPERKRLNRLIKRYGLINDFILLGFKENPYPYIKECDIYVQPSRFEGLGLTVIEAKLLGKPMIITCFSTSNSLIKNGQNGLICDITPKSIFLEIIKLIEMPNMVEGLVAKLRGWKYDGNQNSLEKLKALLTNEN